MASPTTLGGVGMAAIGSFPVGGSSDPLNPGIFLFLDGASLTTVWQAESLEMTEEIGGVKHLEFLHQLLAGGTHLSPGRRVIFRQETVNLFLGTIDRLEEVKVSGNEALFTRLEAVDLNALLERRFVTIDTTYTSQLAGAIVKNLMSTYLAGEGITVNSVQDGPILADFTVEAFTSIAKALRNLSDLTGFVWFVDALGDLHFEVQTAAQAPFEIFGGLTSGLVVALSAPNATVWQVKVTNDGILQTVLSSGLTPITMFIRAQDAGIWEVRLTNDGLLQTVLGGSAFTNSGFLLTAPNGESWAVTVTNDGLLQTRLGSINPLDGVRVTESREQYRNRQTVRYGSDLALSVTVDDTAEQTARKAIEGGSGIYHAVEDASEIAASAEATVLANAILRRFGDIPRTVQFSTRVRGLRPGQTVSVTLAKHNIAANFLIDRVALRDEGNQILRWDITALSGEHFSDSMEFWRHLAGAK